MKLFVKFLSSMTIALALLVPFSANAASGGAYASSIVPGTIYSKNFWYNSYFPIVGATPPASGKINGVNYYWGYANRPAGLVVYLCHATAGCTKVTSFQSGTTHAFDNYAPNVQLYLHAEVTGTGTMSPDYGQTSQVIVNWAY